MAQLYTTWPDGEEAAAIARKKRAAGDSRETRYTVLRFRLRPTAEQTELIEKTFGCCRYLWNKMLSDAQEFYAATDLHYIPTPAHYKEEAPFLRETDSQALCSVHQNLRKAYQDFFRAPGHFGYPQFKTKKDKNDSFTVYCRQYHAGPSIYLTEKGIQMPKLGLVPAVIHRRPLHWWSLVSVTVTRNRSEKYFCSVVFRCPVREAEPIAPTAERTLGLEYSPSLFYVDSRGDSPQPPDLTASREKLRRMQSRLSRMEPGSRNYLEQLRKIRLLHERMANQRSDFIHKESRRIANAWDAVCVSETDLVARQSGGAAFEGFGMFRQCLKYKLERQGKQYIAVDAPTAQEIKQQGLARLRA